MQLESYTSDLCLLQKEEKLRHLSLRCPFTKNYWMTIGVVVPSCLRSERATRHIKRNLGLPFAMNIIIIMCWSIWMERNAWIFNNIAPSVDNYKANLKRDLPLVIHRTKKGKRET
jgi:hypothetical protein